MRNNSSSSSSSLPSPCCCSSSSSASHHHHHHHNHQQKQPQQQRHQDGDLHLEDEACPHEQEEERRHLMEVVVAFLEYTKYTGKEIERRGTHLSKLPAAHARLLRPESLAPALRKQRTAVLTNQAFLEAVVQRVDEIAPAGDMLAATLQLLQKNVASPCSLTTPGNESKIRATLHSCMREWSEEGAAERAVCFGKLLDALEEYLPVTPLNRHLQRVLVPGAGLGRLPLEIVARGYACQGNEFSYFMLLTSNFILNGIERPNAFVLYPFLDQTCNRIRMEDNVREIRVPDVCAGDLLEQAVSTAGGMGGKEGSAENAGKEGPDQMTPNFSMTAGEFLQVYGDQAGCWDAVVTCFFLDTAPVVIDYVQAIHRLLRPGGVWLNFGPLLYHWAAGDVGSQPDERFTRSIELSWEEVRHVMVEGFGFAMQREEIVAGVTYSCNAASMMKTVYNCLFFVATKKPGAEEK